MGEASTTRLVGRVAQYFPYPEVRPFQDEFANAIYEAVEAGSHVILEGSNGLGKTVAALSACLPVAEERDLRILYVAKTHQQHDRVIEELQSISKRREISGISVRGRREVCLHPLVLRHAPDARSAMEVCELLKQTGKCPYYESFQGDLDWFMDVQTHIVSHPCTASEIRELCRRRGVCPYELVKRVMGDVDVISLSYLYVFDSSIRSAFLKHLEKPLDRVILIVDEAHNLPETALEIASETLTLFTIRMAEQEARRFDHPDIAAFSRRLREIVEDLASKVDQEAHIHPLEILERLQREVDLGEPQSYFEYLCEVGGAIRRSLLMQGRSPRSYIHKVGRFLLKWMETSEDEAFTHILARYVTKAGATSSRLEIVALDPSRVTAPVFSSVYCSVVMSGTLEPMDAYIQIMGMPENTVQRSVPAPFPPENVLALACRGVTTLMRKRTREMYRKLVRRIAEAIRYSPEANVGVFAASYEVLQGILEAGIEHVIDRKLFVERQGMSSRENDRLIREFKSWAGRGGAVLLGVEGGRASEGTDYPGRQMETVVIVGVPYAQPSPRVEAQIRYYESRFPGCGREYGYIWPALRRASQAAGRPIRSLRDRGAIIFLDYRFTTAYCRRYLPSWIRRSLKVLPDEDGAIARELMLFFGFRT